MITKYKLFEMYDDEDDDDILSNYDLPEVPEDKSLNLDFNNMPIGEDLYEDEFIEILENECSDFLNGADFFYRGIEDTFDFRQYDPSKYTRKASGGTPNHYMLLLDNLPGWKSIQKRSKSLIFTNDLSTALTYGTVYAVIPFDSARLSYVEYPDIWNAVFVEFGKDKLSLPYFANCLKEENMPDTNYGQLISSLKALAIKGSKFIRINDLLEPIRNGKSVVDTLDNAIKCTVKNITYGDKYPTDRDIEMWTESQCLVVDIDKYNSMAKRNNLRLLKK